MENNFDYKITFQLNNPFDINFVKNACEKYKDSTILVEVQNTKGITSSMIRELPSNASMRIAGGYDDERCKSGRFKGNGYYDSVIYTKNETIKILEEIEKIESGINENWSEIQKLIYVYDKLKISIMYDPNNENKLSSEIRSLRGLLTKETVCAGYALILKEFMDRNGIDCEYVEGSTRSDGSGGHSWNIINIGDKKYPIDLTWDNQIFRSGTAHKLDWFAKDIKSFSETHFPEPGEKTQDYEHTLSQLDPKFIRQLTWQTGAERARDYRSTTFIGHRHDGSKFVVAQIGSSTIDGVNYYRYYYFNYSEDGKWETPKILFSESNVTLMMDRKNFRKEVPDEYVYSLGNVLFSEENINDSLSKNTCYIGKVRKDTVGNKPEFVSSFKEIIKSEDNIKKFGFPTKTFTRSDGSVLIAQQMFKEPINVCGVNVMRYDIFEMVKENSKFVLKRNTVFTEKNFFRDSRQSMVDDYLSRSRLDRKVREAGGYIGYYSQDGVRTYNPNLVKYFETSKKVDINEIYISNQEDLNPNTNYVDNLENPDETPGTRLR